MQKPVTASELLNIKAFADKVKLLNKGANMEKEITHVTIMEAPDLYEWVTGGEMVLTTWYAFSKNPEYQEASFRELVKKISAVGIKLHRFIEKIPDTILEIATEAGVPIFEVYYSVKFRELVTIVNYQIQNYRTNMLLEVEEFYARLMRQSINSDNIWPLVKLLANELHYPVFCLNHKNEILAEENNKTLSKNEINDLIKKVRNHSDYKKASVKNMHFFGCYARNKRIGTLVIIKDGDMDEKEQLKTQQGASFLSMKMWLEYQVEQRSIEKFWHEITTAEFDNEKDIIQRLKHLNIHVEDKFRICLFYGEGRAELPIYFTNKLIIENENYTIMLCCSPNYLQELDRVKKEFQKRDTLVVTTPEFSDALKIRRYFNLALGTLNLLKKTGHTGIQNTDDYLVYTLLQHKKDTEEYQFIYTRVLVPLLEHDNKNRSNLLPALHSALFCKNLETAARECHIHVNTLRYKLRNIKEITGRNFFDNKDKYVLLTAILLWQMDSN